MQETIEAVRKSFQTDLDSFPTERREIEALNSKYFGRKGALAKLFSQMGKISPEDRPSAGKLINDLKQELTKIFDTKAAELLDPAERTTENVDYTLPGETQRTRPADDTCVSQTRPEVGPGHNLGPVSGPDHEDRT